MKKWAILLLAALCCAQAAFAFAEGAAPGAYAGQTEAALRAEGLGLVTETTLSWGGFPLLDEETNSALASLLAAAQVRAYAQGAEGQGYAGMELLLGGVPVADMALLTLDGAYYEQSSLLGGQTVAFEKAEFATFLQRLSSRAGGVFPKNLDFLYDLAGFALGGGDVTVDMDTLNEAIAAYDAWGAGALTTSVRLRPQTFIPGIYGARAVVTEVTRAEALSLADTFGKLLAEREGLWAEAVRKQLPDDEPEAARLLAGISETLAALPDALAAWLPADLPPSQWREIYGLTGALVSRQLSLNLPGLALTLEWIPEAQGASALCLFVSGGESECYLLATREQGTPVQSGKALKTQHKTVAELSLSDGDLRLDAMITHTEDIETGEGRETILQKTECILQSDELLGEGAVVTLLVQRTDRAQGQGEGYERTRDTALRLEGLGLNDQAILTVSSKTNAAKPLPPIDPKDAVRPAHMDDEALDAWLAGVQVSLVQAALTCLGRLPPDVAAYVLARLP